MGVLEPDLDSSWNIINPERLNELRDIEVLVFDRILKHHTVREIAKEFYLTPQTIQGHRSRIYAKFKIYPRTAQQLRSVWIKCSGGKKKLPWW